MNRLKELRKENRLTVRDLEKKLIINRTSLSKMENGDQNINDEYLTMLARFYNVSTDYLLGISNIRNEKELKDTFNKIKERDTHNYGEIPEEKLDANLEEILSRAKIRYQGRELTKPEIKAILNTAKSILDLRDDENK